MIRADLPRLPPGIRALSFDLDDTFWDCAPAILRAEDALLDWFARHAPRVASAHDHDSRRAVRDRVLAERPELSNDVTAFRRQIIDALLREHGYDDSLVDQAFTVFRAARSEVVLYEGVVDMLDRLPSRYKVAAITNGNADLSQIGIERHFLETLAASLDNPPKPAPDMFLTCIDRFGIEPHELLHIGDNAQTDVGGAQACGARSLWFNPHRDVWPASLPPADVEVHSIAALSRLLLEQVV